MGGSSFGRLFTENTYNRVRNIKLGTSVTEGRPETSRDGPSDTQYNGTGNSLFFTDFRFRAWTVAPRGGK